MQSSKHIENPDVVIVGSGIMSANLAVLLKRLEPRLKVQVYEVTDTLAQEASNGWNNAGTGHAGICELSYTPAREADGTVSVKKVIEIFEQFEQSLQFWAFAVAEGMIANPRECINPIPHLSFVHGQTQVDFLKDRHAGMSAHHFFKSMIYSTDRKTIGSWAPLLMEGRAEMPVAATRMDSGTDVNFGNIARNLLQWLDRQEGCSVAAGHRVIDLGKRPDGWDVTVRNVQTGADLHNTAKFCVCLKQRTGGGSVVMVARHGRN